MTEPFRYIFASRSGLFLVDHDRWLKAAEGQFFGVTVMDGDIYAFRAELGGWSPDKRNGCIVRYRRNGDGLIEDAVLVRGLDNECHQVDFFDGAFFVVDTYGQAVLEFDSDWRLAAAHHPVPPAPYKAWDEGYVHMNSFLGRGDRIYLMLHNGGASRPSELLVVDRSFASTDRIPLTGDKCHDIAELEDGRLLYCASLDGRLRTADGSVDVEIDQLMTRGLAVSEDEIAVGSSLFDMKPHRLLTPGFVTFLGRDYRRLSRVHVPAAPTQIRRLDGVDLSLSQPRRTLVAATANTRP